MEADIGSDVGCQSDSRGRFFAAPQIKKCLIVNIEKKLAYMENGL